MERHLDRSRLSRPCSERPGEHLLVFQISVPLTFPRGAGSARGAGLRGVRIGLEDRCGPYGPLRVRIRSPPLHSARELTDHLVEQLERRPPLNACGGSAYRVDVEQAVLRCVREKLAELVLRHDLRTVHERASDARARDAVDDRRVLWMQGWRVMHDDSGWRVAWLAGVVGGAGKDDVYREGS